MVPRTTLFIQKQEINVPFFFVAFAFLKGILNQNEGCVSEQCRNESGYVVQ